MKQSEWNQNLKTKFTRLFIHHISTNIPTGGKRMTVRTNFKNFFTMEISSERLVVLVILARPFYTQNVFEGEGMNGYFFPLFAVKLKCMQISLQSAGNTNTDTFGKAFHNYLSEEASGRSQSQVRQRTA